MMLPSLHELADVFKCLAIETFCEVVCPLFFGVNFQDGDVAIGDVAPKEVPLDEEILRPVGDTLFRGEKKSAVVVFEDATSNCRFELGWKTKCRDDFSEKGSEWQERPHARAEGGVFRFKSRQRCFRLEFGLPKNGASSKCDNVTCS